MDTSLLGLKSNFSYLLEQLKMGPEISVSIAYLALIFTRIFTMIMITPFIGARSVPGRIRVVTTIALTAFIYPILLPSLQAVAFPGFGLPFVLLMLKEALIGISVGIVASMVFYGIQAAGLMIDNQRGVANAQILIPQLGTQGSVFGLFQFQAAIALFLSIGGHRDFLQAFFEGFVRVPILTMPPFAENRAGIYPFFEMIIRLSGDVLLLAARLSAPVIIAIFLADVVLGIANKVAPSINVFELGFGVKGIVGVIVVFISITVLYHEFNVVSFEMIDHVREMFRLLIP